MPKILAQVGMSLADMYNIAGSIAGVETLHSREVSLVHELGHAIFSERFTTDLHFRTTGAIAQTLPLELIMTGAGIPVQPFRVYGIQVFINVTARITFASVAVRDPLDGREIPIWSWDIGADVEKSVRWSQDGGAAGTVIFLQPQPANVDLPMMMAGLGQPSTGLPGAERGPAGQLVFRGLTATFGAGTVTTGVLLNLGMPTSRALSSLGLPIPSW